jgi:hypothetical protein
MRKYLSIGLLGAAMLWLDGRVMATEAETPAGSIRLTTFRLICLPEKPNDAERSMVKVLQEKLQALYGMELTVGTGRHTDEPAILLGRDAALAAGAMTRAELEAVKTDGYVIKLTGKRLVLAGYAAQGTIYATYAFLHRAGLRLYPWRNFEAVEIRTPLPGGVLKPFEVARKPYFERRDLLGWLDQGRWGASLLEYSLGDFRSLQDHPWFKGKGWLGADHTAPYLVPMAVYQQAHPEYYALSEGKRLPSSTQNARVALCLSNPEVARIAAERAREWMGSQKARRFFHITDGDTRECHCPECRALDPDPTSYTDRYLRWVNAVAGAVRERFPENVVMALAYIKTTRPPREIRPGPNVVVLYCPWYWTSRTTSAVSWANPLNVTAMKEFTAWAMRFPGQVGLYDYPDSWFHGLAERLKFLAKRDVRIFYACGGSGDLYQWVNARLLWDPFLNTEDLVEEFVQSCYGPAAKPLGEYLRLKQETIEKRLVHGRDPLGDGTFLLKAAELLGRAEEAARAAEDRTKARILANVFEGRFPALQYGHPVSGSPGLRRDAGPYRRELEQYARLSAQVTELYQRLGNRYAARAQRRELGERLQLLGLMPGGSDEIGDVDAGRVLAAFDEQVRKSPPVAERPATITSCRFDTPGEAGRWLSDGSQAALVSPPEKATVESPDGLKQAGVRIRAPLSQLPVIPYGKLKIHAGRFYTERTFDPPFDAEAGSFLDFHVWASADVPITIYINDVHSDVDLHRGEQIVRVDMRNFDQKARFSYDSWDKKVRRVSFDLWPQDNFFPYPAVSDVEVAFLSLTASQRKPVPDQLPHAGRAIWLSQFRPNVPRGVAVPRELYDQYLQRGRYKHVGLDYGSRWISERFRTFTEYRSVTPLLSIVTSAEATAAERAAAGHLQDGLERMFGVRLPVRQEKGITAGAAGNAILLGRQACLAAGKVSEGELQYVGPGGMVINAHQGHVAIAGPDEQGTGSGVLRYLEDHGLRLFGPDRIRVPDRRGDCLHELYLADWPHFRVPFREAAWSAGGTWLDWYPQAIANISTRNTQASLAVKAGAADIARARALAETIKDCARASRKEVPSSVLEEANRSPVSRYLAGRILWDPWADTSRLVREMADSSKSGN